MKVARRMMMLAAANNKANSEANSEASSPSLPQVFL